MVLSETNWSSQLSGLHFPREERRAHRRAGRPHQDRQLRGLEPGLSPGHLTPTICLLKIFIWTYCLSWPRFYTAVSIPDPGFCQRWQQCEGVGSGSTVPPRPRARPCAAVRVSPQRCSVKCRYNMFRSDQWLQSSILWLWPRTTAIETSLSPNDFYP